MNSHRHIFHLISYLQYPFYAGGLIYVIISLFRMTGVINESGIELTTDQVLEIGFYFWNIAFFLFGLGVSFSTLQDTSKTQNKLSQRVWQDPKKGKLALVFMTLTALFFVTLGLLGMLVFPESIIGMLSYGFLAFGIAYICVVRSAIEMFEHHRLDREKINQI